MSGTKIQFFHTFGEGKGGGGKAIFYIIFHGRFATRESRLGGKNPPILAFGKGGPEGI
jgi:hypothetical protein